MGRIIVNFVPKKPKLTYHIINNGGSYRGVEKDGPNELNKSQLFALCLMAENFESTSFLYLLVVPEASLKDGVFKFIAACA